jgi:hypothetical protein
LTSARARFSASSACEYAVVGTTGMCASGEKSSG